MPTPPAAYARWKSTRSVVTRERWLRPSYVAALITRLREGQRTEPAGREHVAEFLQRVPLSQRIAECGRRAIEIVLLNCPICGYFSRHRPGDAGSMQLEGPDRDQPPRRVRRGRSPTTCSRYSPTLTTATSRRSSSSSRASAAATRPASRCAAATEYHVPITFGIAPQVLSAEDAFCRMTMGSEEVMTVEDAWADPDFASISQRRRPAGPGPVLRLGAGARPQRRDGGPAVRDRQPAQAPDDDAAAGAGDPRAQRLQADRAAAGALGPPGTGLVAVARRDHGAQAAHRRARPRPAGAAHRRRSPAWRCSRTTSPSAPTR